jgi:hypothetical protein
MFGATCQTSGIGSELSQLMRAFISGVWQGDCTSGWLYRCEELIDFRRKNVGEGDAMYVSRLTFHTQPGKTQSVEQKLHKLLAMVSEVGGLKPRVLRNHFASLGAPDVVFEQEAPDLATLETQIKQVAESPGFQQWTGDMSGLLAQSPKREVYLIVD